MSGLIVVSVLEPYNADATYHKVFEGMGQCTRMLDRVHLPDGFRMPDIGKPDVIAWTRLTIIANVALYPPSICLSGVNPCASDFWSDEWYTISIRPAGIPSWEPPPEAKFNQVTSAVAVWDWRGTRRCRVRKERNKSHASSDPITFPHWVLVSNNLHVRQGVLTS